jgi:Fe(3+) dicitrate transport protein
VALTCIDENGDLDVGCGDQNGAGLDELVGGKVDDVWLLSARTNLRVTDNLTLFMAGTNLTDELYIAELSDGAKPGQGRTILGGFTLKFD